MPSQYDTATAPTDSCACTPGSGPDVSQSTLTNRSEVTLCTSLNHAQHKRQTCACVGCGNRCRVCEITVAPPVETPLGDCLWAMKSENLQANSLGLNELTEPGTTLPERSLYSWLSSSRAPTARQEQSLDIVSLLQSLVPACSQQRPINSQPASIFDPS